MKPESENPSVRGAVSGRISMFNGNNVMNPNNTLSETSAMFNVKEPGMSAASRERYHRELSYLKATLDYDVISRQNDEISTRLALIEDIRRNYP